MVRILVTGSAGFIGFHLSRKLVEMGFMVVGLDNLNNYYDPQLKLDRLKLLGISEEKARFTNNLTISEIFENIKFIRLDIQDRIEIPRLFEKEKFDIVINLAAQAGVRYSLENPEAYIDSNVVGFLNLLECCRHNNIKHFIYASSSSVYGENDKVPFSVDDNVDHPISLYAATKKSNELMAHSYSHLYNFKTTGLRFFTVYGPWGRPDMAMFLFTDAIINNIPINVFNNGNLERDFTYIDDIVDGIIKILKGNSSVDNGNYNLYNIGNSSPVKLLDFIDKIEEHLNLKANKNMMPMQAGDVSRTWADVEPLMQDFNYNPKTTINEGVKSFITWYKSYYNFD